MVRFTIHPNDGGDAGAITIDAGAITIDADNAAQAVHRHVTATWKPGDDDTLEFEAVREDGRVFNVTVDVDVDVTFSISSYERGSAPQKPESAP